MGPLNPQSIPTTGPHPFSWPTSVNELSLPAREGIGRESAMYCYVSPQSIPPIGPHPLSWPTSVDELSPS